MVNRRRKKKAPSSINEWDGSDRFKTLVTESVDLVREMTLEAQTQAWYHWNIATETLRHIVQPASSMGCVSLDSHPKSTTGGTTNHPDHTGNCAPIIRRPSVGTDSKSHPEFKLDIMLNGLQSQTKYILTKQQLCVEASNVQNGLRLSPGGAGVASPTANTSRRSIRKRQATAKMKELERTRQSNSKSIHNRLITAKDAANKASKPMPSMCTPTECVSTITATSNQPVHDKEVIFEIIRCSMESDNTNSYGLELCESALTESDRGGPGVTGVCVPHSDEVVSGGEAHIQGVIEAESEAVNAAFVRNVADEMNMHESAEKTEIFLNMENCLDVNPIPSDATRPLPTQTPVCSDCGEVCTDNKALMKHRRTKHTERCGPRSAPMCIECGKMFTNKSNLKSHINLCHKGQRDFLCSDCGKEFHSRSNLHRHFRTHTGVKPWKCDKCNVCFTEKKSLERHALVHTGLKLYKCEVCGKCLSTPWSLKQHHVAQHETCLPMAFLCDVCGKTFSLKTNLHSHRKVHLVNRPHPCTLCKRSFCGKGDLDRHMRSHTGEKPYDCQVCNKRFSRLDYLREHLNAHAGIMPYTCPTCGKGFTDRSGYHKHSKRCALKKPSPQEDHKVDDVDEVDDQLVGSETHEQAAVRLDALPLDDDTQNQVGFIGLDPHTTELQVHQIFCTNQTVPDAVATEHVIEVAPVENTYTVLSEEHMVGDVGISDFAHQTATLSVDCPTVETLHKEAQCLTTGSLQWYVQDVVNTEPSPGMGGVNS